MKYFRTLSPLTIAIAVSLAAHAALLGVRFAAPDSFRLKPADAGLEVILVNAKHAKRPLKADAVANADLEGGGNADTGRSKSPLPDLKKTEEGDSMQAAQRKIEDLVERQDKLLTQTRTSAYRTAPLTEKEQPDQSRTGADLIESSKVLARQAAEISTRIEEQNKRPRKTFLTPSTIGVGYAVYYAEMSRRIEEIGTLNFPQKEGRKLYGQVILSIPVFQDGSIYQKEGGVRIAQSSGNPDLDKAALAIVRRSAPFGRFPPKMLSSDKDDVWEVTTTFKFARNDTMQAQQKGSE